MMYVFYGRKLTELEELTESTNKDVRCFSPDKKGKDDLLDFLDEHSQDIEAIVFIDLEKIPSLSREVATIKEDMIQIAVVEEKNHEENSYLDLLLKKEEWLSRWILKKVEEQYFKEKSKRLKKTLSSTERNISIFVHDDPDPDAIASAMALEKICDQVDVDSTTYFGGSIGHPENEIFLENTDFVIENVDRRSAKDVVEKSGKIAFVDFAETSGNPVLPEDTRPDIIIDHHYTNKEVRAREYDEIRSDIGATSTMMTKHLLNLDINIDSLLGAALLFGIKVDTQQFTQNMSPADHHAISYLSATAEKDLLNILQRSPIYSETLEAVGRAIQNRKIEKNVLTTFSGHISHSDDLSQIADIILKERDILTVLVYGIKDDKIHMSVRSEDLTKNVGKIMERAYSDIGEAGGHEHAAGGIVPLDRFDDEKEAEEEIAQLFLREVLGS